MRVVSLALAVMAVLPLAHVEADTIAYDNPAGVSPLQDFGNNLGLDFNVTTPIRVTELGAFDDGVLANLNGMTGAGIDVGIFDRVSQTLVGPTVHFSSTTPGSQTGGDAFLPVNFTLQNGSYSIVAYNDDNANTNGAANTGTSENPAGFITFVDGGLNGGGLALAYPGNGDGGPTDRYDAGTFAFVQAPEPTTISLFSLGLMGLGITVRRRWKRSASTTSPG